MTVCCRYLFSWRVKATLVLSAVAILSGRKFADAVAEIEPGVFLLISDPGQSCTDACSQNNLVCTKQSLLAAVEYYSGAALGEAVAAAGGVCDKVREDRWGTPTPMIDGRNYCFGKLEGSYFNCKLASGMQGPGRRLCSCFAAEGPSPPPVPTKAPATKSPWFPPTKKPIEAVSQTKAPTEESAPTVSPRRSPVRDPTEAPATDPTEAPAADPTDSPVADPTEAPAPNPTDFPVADPTEAPAAGPTEAPAADPTYTPVADPTEAPAPDPTKAPTPNPTKAPAPNPTKAPTVAPKEPPSVPPTSPPPPVTDPPVPATTKNPTPVPTPSSSALDPSELPPPGYVEVWRDDFDGNDIDPNNWSRGLIYDENPEQHVLWDPKLGGPHLLSELYDGYILDKNVIVKDGVIQLLNREENNPIEGTWPTGTYYHSSGFANSLHKTFFNGSKRGKGNYLEMRARFPHGDVGKVWAAVWLVPESENWPPEIDIWEYFGIFFNSDWGVDQMQYRIRYGWYGNTTAAKVRIPDYQTRFGTGWHIFGWQWTWEYMIWYIDGEEIGRLKNGRDIFRWRWPDEDMAFVLQNGLMESVKPDDPVMRTKFPNRLLIDWMVLYEKM